MSSDYIPRLRSELLRAGAQQPSRPLPKPTLRRLRPLAVAAVIVALIATVVLTVPGGSDPEVAADAVQFRYRVEPAAETQATALNLRERLSRLGVRGASVSTTATGVTITAPAAARADIAALTQPGRLAIYDWEESVLGPRGRPEPEDESVTGGENAGQAATLGEREAKARGHAVQTTSGGWYALGDTRALTNAEIAAAEPSTADQASVSLLLTTEGRLALRTLTRDLARRGARLQTNQHLAITLDDRLVSVPYLDWQRAPDGLEDIQIAGSETPHSARRIAAILNAGPLPASLS
jgi:preprotein translocase subunit SecD